MAKEIKYGAEARIRQAFQKHWKLQKKLWQVRLSSKSDKRFCQKLKEIVHPTIFYKNGKKS